MSTVLETYPVVHGKCALENATGRPQISAFIPSRILAESATTSHAARTAMTLNLANETWYEASYFESTISAV